MHPEGPASCNLSAFLFRGDLFLQIVGNSHKNRWIIRFRIFRSSSSQWKMIVTDECPSSTRRRIEYITSCLLDLFSPYFGEFWVNWPLVVFEILPMGSIKSEIRISFVIIAKSYCTTSVFWHDNKLLNHVPICILCSCHRALAPVVLHPGKMALTLKGFIVLSKHYRYTIF